MIAATSPRSAHSATRMLLRDVLEHARQLLRTGEHDACEALCVHVLEQVPDQPVALHLLAILMHLQGRSAEAIGQLESVVERVPDDAAVRLDLANLLIEGDRFEAALEHLQQVLVLDPQSALAWNSRAVACLRSGRLDECDAALTSGLALEPGRDDLLNNLALLRRQQGRIGEAIELMKAAAERAPEAHERWTSLGAALVKAGRHAEAAEAFRRRLLLGSDTAEACWDLGLALLRCDRLDDSEAALRHGLQLDPDAVELHDTLARVLHRAGRHREALEHGAKVLAVEPISGSLRQLMSESLRALGERDAALEVLRRWAALDRDDPEPARLAAALAAEIAAEARAAMSAEELTAELAASFDSRLAALQSRAPELVAAALRAVARRLPPAAEILDAGCGTGPCGPLVKPLAGRLVGVDAVSALLERARARDVYDALEACELAEFLARSPQSFDAIVSADAVDDFGDLKDFAAAAARALRPRGVLIFTLLALDDGASGHALLVNGRHAHSRAHVQRALQAGGFAPTMITSDTLHDEQQAAVRGWVVTALRRDG